MPVAGLAAPAGCSRPPHYTLSPHRRRNPFMLGDNHLAAHWPLSEDARDVSGSDHHGDARGVVFQNGAALFDGRHAHIEVADAPGLKLGKVDFTIAAWIYTEDQLD